MTGTTDKLREAIATEIRPGTPLSALGDDAPLLEQQIIDSLGIFALVSYIEREFGLEIPDDELLPENFGSIGAIARFIDEKRSDA